MFHGGGFGGDARNCAGEDETINLASEEVCCEGLIPEMICDDDGACILSERICKKCAGAGANVYDMASKGPTSCCGGFVLQRCEGECTPSILGTCVAGGDADNEGEPGENSGLGQRIRNRVRAGTYTSETGEQIRVREMAQNRIGIASDDVEAETELEVEEEDVGEGKTRLKAKMSNGRNAEIKIMPDVASEKALARLRLRVCNAENKCSIELKEVGKGENVKPAYEMQIQRHSKILGLFRAKMQVRAQVNAENGEVIRVKKPWWAFIASEPEEE